LRHATRNVLDALGAADGRTAVLLDDQGHDCKNETAGAGEKRRILIEFAAKNEPTPGRRENCHHGFDDYYAKRISADNPFRVQSLVCVNLSVSAMSIG
jgi:hypothetical protein